MKLLFSKPQLSRSENEAAQMREQEYLEKISEMTAKIADITSTNTGGRVSAIVNVHVQ